MRLQIRMSLEDDAEHVEDLALEPVRPVQSGTSEGAAWPSFDAGLDAKPNAILSE